MVLSWIFCFFIFCVLHARKRLRNILKIQFSQKVRNAPFLLNKTQKFLSIVSIVSIVSTTSFKKCFSLSYYEYLDERRITDTHQSV